MIKSELDWRNFDWKYFQTLAIEIAKTLVPDCSFYEYLKPGQKQEGIDIHGFQRSNGKYFSIQCKKVNNISKSELATIINEFRSGEYFDKSSNFIIVTSADLQTPDLQKNISANKIELSNYSIEFDCWDKRVIETLLKDKWDLVSYYFGEEQAEGFCYPRFRFENLETFSPILDFIPRKITPFEKNSQAETKIWYYTQRQTYDLKEIFTKDRLATHHVCIIADAYQGKSFYLRQTAYLLQQYGENIYPILIEVKKFNEQPIQEILSKSLGAWKKIPLKDMILIIDGLDEAPTEKFIEVIKHINEFSRQYSPMNIVFSCRKLFFNKYEVQSLISGFDIFELCSLESFDVAWYLSKKLGTEINNFQSIVSHSGIGSLLYHPFYLTHLVEEFLSPPYTLPDNKVKIIDGIINRSFNTSLKRQYTSSDSINSESNKFKRIIEKFSFSLQLAGVNAFNNADMQVLFNREERLLLQHNSLILHTGEIWSFNNALFQEHIAASLLSQMSYENILGIATVGEEFKKIKTKWIQTISSLLSILNNNDSLFKKILDLIENDNIELIFQTESSKYENSLKLSLLQSLIERCATQNIRPFIVYEETIGVFISQCLNCSRYLIESLEKAENSELVKTVCCRILKTTHLNNDLQNRYLIFLKKELPHTLDGYYAGNLIEVLTVQKLGCKELIEELIIIERLNEQHEFRDNVYELILVLGLVDDFYFYGVEGLPYLVNHNKMIQHGGSEVNLEEFLLAGRKSKNLISLLKRFNFDGWLEYFQHHGGYKADFFSCFFEKLAELYKEDPFIVFPVAEFIRQLGKKYLRDEFKQVDVFIEQTNTHSIILRILIFDILKENDWELASLITKDSYDYLFFEYEIGEYGLKELRSCLSGLRYKQKTQIADDFFKLSMDITEGRIIDENESNKHKEYLDSERRRLDNDLIYIQSIDSFKIGIRKYFESYGKRTIPADDLYVDIEGHRGEIRKMTDSYFVFEYLANWHRENKTVSLNTCLKALDFGDNFEFFRAKEILDYPYKTENSDKVLFPILEKYYNDNLPLANFENCMWSSGNQHHWLRKEFLLGQIFKKFQFKTEDKYLLELIWLDTGGTRSFQSDFTNKSISIAGLVILHLSEAGKIKLRKKVIDNIKEGIKMESILGTHIGLCKQLKIVEAKDIILRCVKETTNEDYLTRNDGIDIYLELGGSIEEVFELYENLENYNDHFFFFLTRILYKTYPIEISHKGINAINSPTTELDRKIQIAQLLSEIGEFEGFVFLVNEIRKNKKSPHHIQAGHPITKTDTTLALLELSDIMYLVLDKDYNNNERFHDTARNIIIEWLYTLANKSEKDLELVVSFIKKSQKNLAVKYSNTAELNWHINKIYENFRNSDQTNKTLLEIKQLLLEIDEEN